MRHYWLRVNYLSFYDLHTDGHVYPNQYSVNEDFSVNAFNIDMVFKWNFAPGSELLLIWKNAVYSNENLAELEDNFSITLKGLSMLPLETISASNYFIILIGNILNQENPARTTLKRLAISAEIVLL